MPLLVESVRAGARAIQLRERDLPTRQVMALAAEVIAAVRPLGAKVLLNDRLDVVMALGADGVHLRSDSLPVGVARRLLGDGPLIGVSVHAAEEAERAEREGADFVVFGPIYETPSKQAYGLPVGPKALEDAARRCRLPIFAVGGLTAERAQEVRRAGARGVAVISSILGAPSVGQATQAMIESLGQTT